MFRVFFGHALKNTIKISELMLVQNNVFIYKKRNELIIIQSRLRV